jgi:hypothetical protein
VIPSHPQNGAASSVHGAPDSTHRHASAQLPPVQMPVVQGEALVHSTPVDPHSPGEATSTPAAAAPQSFPYVMPSQPHTGS